jgi:hypothetical protein
VAETEVVEKDEDTLCNSDDSEDEGKNEHSDYDYQQPRSNTAKRSRFQELPEDLPEVLDNSVFENDNYFEVALVELKIADFPLVLGDNGKVCYYNPHEYLEHKAARNFIVNKFLNWALFKGQGCRKFQLYPRTTTGWSTPTHKLGRKTKTRLPDVSFWGRSKCELESGDGGARNPLKVLLVDDPQPVEVHPHVVIQVDISFDDEDCYEVDAINDLANHAVAGRETQPNLAVLIKLHEKGRPGAQAGFDIYYLPTGTFLENALNGTKRAKHVVYNHGGSDALMTVTEQDLGGIKLTLWQSIKDYLLGDSSKDFKLSTAELYGIVF